MGIFNKLFAAGKIDDEPLDIQTAEVGAFGQFGIEEGCDEITGSKGPFGYSLSNPIPVNGIIGEACYINRLRSKSGVGFFCHRLGSLRSPVSEHPIDKYELAAVDASQWAILYFSPYYARRSLNTPDGMKLIGWSSLEKGIRLMSKLHVFGTNGCDSSFPFGLPDIVSKSPQLREISPSLGEAMSRRIVNLLQSNKGKWQRPYVL
jgi:hypothetical protein